MDSDAKSRRPAPQIEGTSDRRRPGRAPALTALSQIALASLAALVVWWMDDWRAITLAYPTYYVWVGGSLLVVLLPALAWRRPAAFVAPALLCAYLGLLPHVETNGLKPLLRSAGELTVGMERSEILATIHRQYEGTHYDLPIVVSETDERILLRPRPAPGNSEGLIVHLRDARFAAASFVPD